MFKDSAKAAERLQDIFKDIRGFGKNRDKIEALVDELEDEKHWHSYYAEKYRTFCEAYIIDLLEEYVYNVKNREILYAVYGLRIGYKDKPTIERCQKYATEAGQFDDRIKSYWKDPNGSLSNIEKKEKVVDGLVENILKAMPINNDSNDKVFLGFANKVYNRVSLKFPNGLPTEYPLLNPRYLHKEGEESTQGSNEQIDTAIEKGSTIDESQGKNEDYLILPEDMNIETFLQLLKYIRQPKRLKVIKGLKVILGISIIMIIIIIFSWRIDKNLLESNGDFQKEIPQPVLDGIQDEDIDSADWEYTFSKDGKTYRTRVSVSHELVTESFEPE